MLFFNRSFLFGIVVLFALAACGGGDGGDDTTVNRAWGTHALIETDDAAMLAIPRSPSTAVATPSRCGSRMMTCALTSGPTAMYDFVLNGSNRPEYGLFTKQHLRRTQ